MFSVASEPAAASAPETVRASAPETVRASSSAPAPSVPGEAAPPVPAAPSGPRAELAPGVEDPHADRAAHTRTPGNAGRQAGLKTIPLVTWRPARPTFILRPIADRLLAI